MAADAAQHVNDEADLAFELLTDAMPAFLFSRHAAIGIDTMLRLDQPSMDIIEAVDTSSCAAFTLRGGCCRKFKHVQTS